MTKTNQPLDSVEFDTLATHLVRRGLAEESSGMEFAALAGGVSNDVLAVTAPGLDAVVKRALGQLRVAEDWFANPARIETEGQALRLAGRLTPHAVPAVLDLSDGYLVIERAPRTWHNWKDDLLIGQVHVPVAQGLGRLLGAWQRATAGAADVEEQFGDRTAFDQLRVDPFHRTIAARHPDLAEQIDRTVEVMGAATTCLVHGDYSPKNVLVDPVGEGLWVIDWEVAHVGDPTFDPAWIIGHLLLKSIYRPASAGAYAEAARAFLTAFCAEVEGAVVIDADQLVRQTGCLVLARVDGKSPVEYLDATGRARAREVGRRLLSDPPTTLLDTWEYLT